ncbi:hypothetical protein [Paenibacillus marinisediminis]
MDTNNLKQQIHDIVIPSEVRHRSELGIRQAVLEQQKEEHGRRVRQRNRTRFTAIAVVLGLVLLSAVLLNHTKVWAAIQKALQFVPGIGIVKEEESPLERYILKQPIHLEVGDGTIVITGILSDEEMTYITMTGVDTPRLDSIMLVNGQGLEYTIDRSTSSWSSKEWTASYWHKGQLEINGDIKLILNLDPPIEVLAHLTRAETYSSYSDLGTTSTVNGLSITAITDRVGDKMRVSLVTPPKKDYTISDYGLYGVYLHDASRKLHVVDSKGKQLGIEHIRGMSSPASDFYFQLSDNGDNGYTLTIPEISVTYQDEVYVKIPTEAQEQMNQSIEIAGYPVTITKIERIQSDVLRVYMDLHYNEQATASLYSFGIEALSSMAQLHEESGAIQFIEIPIEPDSKDVNLKLIRPEVVMRGPWNFTLPAVNQMVEE